jgi:hypothetical protein
LTSRNTTRLVIVSLTALMAVAALAYAWVVQQARSARIELIGDSLRVQGPLVDESVAAALALMDNAPTPVKRVVLRSQGGDMRAAMRLGIAIFERGLDVEVDSYCVAACANYVFVAGANKRIRAGSLVAWFGSANAPDFVDGSWEVSWRKAQQCEISTADCEARVQKLRDYLQAARTEQDSFFQRIGVDQRITLFGQTERQCNCSWTLRLTDMQQFGINAVQSDGVYFSELDYWALQAGKESQVRMLDLSAVSP